MSKDEFTKILVAEDNADDSFMLLRQLEKAQLDDHVTFVETGRAALDFLLSTDRLPLALFLDLRLPDINGVQILEKIKQEPRLKNLRVVVMTGSSDPRDLAECNRLGVTAFLTKPVELATFIKTVTHLFPAKVTST